MYIYLKILYQIIIGVKERTLNLKLIEKLRTMRKVG